MYFRFFLFEFSHISKRYVTFAQNHSMEKLKKRWGIESNWAIVAILIVFAINGSFAAWVSRPVTEFFGVTKEAFSPWVYHTFRFLLIFPIYQITLPIVGWLFGQFKFFWNFEKKFLTRLGLGFLFKNN